MTRFNRFRNAFHPSGSGARRKLLALITALLLVSLACALPGAPTPSNGDTAGTAVAQTLAAYVDQTNTAAVGNGGDVPTATDAPADTPTATLTPEPSETPTQSIPIISVSVDTNCRIGPGNIYSYAGGLVVGEEAEVIARDPSGNYWYIENPDSPGSYCWVWGEYATIEGDTSGLPVFTPPPTPTPTFTPTPVPNFSVAFDSIQSCVGWPAQFIILNNGGVTWESGSIVITDENTSFTTNTVTFNDFTERNACLDGASHYDRLNPGVQGYATSYDLNQNPSGHTVTGTITLCTQDNLGGFCMSRHVNFTP